MELLHSVSKYWRRIAYFVRLSKTFCQRFHLDHPSLTMKRQGNVSMNRALNCTREMAESHLDDLASELIKCGIMTDVTKHDAGVYTATIDTSRYAFK